MAICKRIKPRNMTLGYIKGAYLTEVEVLPGIRRDEYCIKDYRELETVETVVSCDPRTKYETLFQLTNDGCCVDSVNVLEHLLIINVTKYVPTNKYFYTLKELESYLNMHDHAMHLRQQAMLARVKNFNKNKAVFLVRDALTNETV